MLIYKNEPKIKSNPFRVKRVNKYYAFKNDARRKSFRSIDSFLKVVYILAFIAFIVSVTAVVVGLAILLISFALVFGFFMPIEDNFGFNMMVFSFKAIPYTVIIYLVVYLLRFIVEWIFLLVERGELKKDKEANKNYLDISSVVIKTKLVSMIVMVITVVVLFAMSKIINNDVQTWQFAFFAIPIVALIIYKIYATKAFDRVQPQARVIAEERNEKLGQIKTKKSENREQAKMLKEANFPQEQKPDEAKPT